MLGSQHSTYSRYCALKRIIFNDRSRECGTHDVDRECKVSKDEIEELIASTMKGMGHFYIIFEVCLAVI